MNFCPSGGITCLCKSKNIVLFMISFTRINSPLLSPPKHHNTIIGPSPCFQILICLFTIFFNSFSMFTSYVFFISITVFSAYPPSITWVYWSLCTPLMSADLSWFFIIERDIGCGQEKLSSAVNSGVFILSLLLSIIQCLSLATVATFAAIVLFLSTFSKFVTNIVTHV